MLTPASGTLLSVSLDGRVVVYDPEPRVVREGAPVWALAGDGHGAVLLADAAGAVTALRPGGAVLWQGSAGSTQYCLCVTDSAETVLATGGADCTVRMWQHTDS